MALRRCNATVLNGIGMSRIETTRNKAFHLVDLIHFSKSVK